MAFVPSSLEVEITESALTKMNETLTILNELKKLVFSFLSMILERVILHLVI